MVSGDTVCRFQEEVNAVKDVARCKLTAAFTGKAEAQATMQRVL